MPAPVTLHSLATPWMNRNQRLELVRPSERNLYRNVQPDTLAVR